MQRVSQTGFKLVILLPQPTQCAVTIEVHYHAQLEIRFLKERGTHLAILAGHWDSYLQPSELCKQTFYGWASLRAPWLSLSSQPSYALTPYSSITPNRTACQLFVTFPKPNGTTTNSIQLKTKRRDLRGGLQNSHSCFSVVCSAVARQPHAEELMKAISGRKAVISPLLKGSLLRNMLM